MKKESLTACQRLLSHLSSPLFLPSHFIPFLCLVGVRFCNSANVCEIMCCRKAENRKEKNGSNT